MVGWNVSFWELWPGGFRLVLRSLMALGECRTNRHSCSTYMACVELLGLREEQRLSEHTLATSVNSRITIVSPQILQIQARPNKVRMRMGTRTDDKTSRSPRTTTRGVSPCQHKHCTTSNKESETKSIHQPPIPQQTENTAGTSTYLNVSNVSTLRRNADLCGVGWSTW